MTSPVVQYRRDLHQIPELGFDLPKTLAYVKDHLLTLPGLVIEPAPSSVCIFFDAGAASTVAFRADMDALPTTESTERVGRSLHEGHMHACGHDGHMAMALALCDYVSEHIDTLPHNVLVIFQPAEETTGGAEPICASGIFSRFNVQSVYGLHMWPGFAAGQIVSRPGPLMARCCEVHVKITGKSVHIAKAHEGADALLAGSLLVSRLADRVPNDPLQLLRFGLLKSGTVGNIVAGSATVAGTLRSFSDDDHEALIQLLTDTATEVEKETGCNVEISLTAGYPAVINDADLFDQVASLGIPITVLDEPPMTGEDFSFYQREAPGVFFFVGTGRTDALHSQTFDFDEAALESGLRLLIALSHLNRGQ